MKPYPSQTKLSNQTHKTQRLAENEIKRKLCSSSILVKMTLEAVRRIKLHKCAHVCIFTFSEFTFYELGHEASQALSATLSCFDSINEDLTLILGVVSSWGSSDPYG